MTNITLSAQPEKIAMLREVARTEGKSANDLFREWLDTTVAAKRLEKKRQWHEALQESYGTIRVDLSAGMPSREERNARK